MLILQVKCDRCGVLGKSGKFYAWTMRHELHDEGWRNAGAIDHCPACLAALESQREPKKGESSCGT